MANILIPLRSLMDPQYAVLSELTTKHGVQNLISSKQTYHAHQYKVLVCSIPLFTNCVLITIIYIKFSCLPFWY